MRTLYHLWLCPFSRKVRVVLKEKGLDFQLRVEKTWERREEFLMLSPAGEVPVLVETDGSVFCGTNAIAEYLDECHAGLPLLGRDAISRAETRRLVEWFDIKFNREVTENLVGEKMTKRFSGIGQPDSRAIRAGKSNVHYHLEYIAWLTERRKWLAGDHYSLADIAAAAHLSALDYMGDVPWEDHPDTKEWYARIKSRPSFRPLLGDHVPGIPPPGHYADLDF